MRKFQRREKRQEQKMKAWWVFWGIIWTGKRWKNLKPTTFRKIMKHLRNPLLNPRKKNNKWKLNLKLVFKWFQKNMMISRKKPQNSSMHWDFTVWHITILKLQLTPSENWFNFIPINLISSVFWFWPMDWREKQIKPSIRCRNYWSKTLSTDTATSTSVIFSRNQERRWRPELIFSSPTSCWNVQEVFITSTEF